MTRTALSRTLAMAITLALVAGCGDGDESRSTDPPPETDETADITTTEPAPTTTDATAPITTEPIGTTTVPPAGAGDLAAYEWQLAADGAPWGGRAGLRVVELDGSLFLIGGRTPRNSPIPGDSVLWGDVWRSDDLGVTWTEVVPSGQEFAPRAYFQAVTMDGAIYVIGGQDFAFPNSTFFNDVWRSTDGETWEQLTAAAPWSGRAGLMAAAFDGHLYVFGGSKNDDAAIIGPTGPVREYFNDVWRSADGVTWEQTSAEAPWAKRAGGAAVEHDGALYLLGGEAGFLCSPLPGCELPYFNDVWRTTDGADWQLVAEAAGWSARPGHVCESIAAEIVCFGGFGPEGNPTDMWSSPDGAAWTDLEQTPWGITSPEQARYDFDSVVVDAPAGPAVLTVGGDRETFEFGDPENYLRVDDDVWWWAAVA